MKKTVVLCLLVASGCASNSGVVPIGQNTFKIYKRGATGFTGSEAVKSDVMFQASEYCTNQKKSLHVLSTILGRPPYILGNFPKAEIQFQCLDNEELEKLSLAEKNNNRENKDTSNSNKNDISTELRNLKKLQDDGLINNSEFETRKKKILSR